MSRPAIVDMGRALYEAERDAEPLVVPLTAQDPDLTVEDAYEVQRTYGELRTAAGATLVGRKVGCTSKAIQELFGVPTPDFGLLFDDMEIGDGGVAYSSELIQPMVEAELAFVLHRDLRGPGVEAADVMAASLGVRPCIEIIDSRIVDWNIQLADTVADNGSSSRFIVGDALVPLDGIDLPSVELTLYKNDEPGLSATGVEVLGNPAVAVAWLANKLAEFGTGIEAGSVVLSGSFAKALPAAPGDRFRAVFPGIGEVSCRFANRRSNE